MSTESVLNAASQLTERQQAVSWCDMNSWRWPAMLEPYKPAQWDSIADDDDKMNLPEAKALWDKLSEVPLKVRLREWNRETMSDSEFESWWAQKH